MGTKKSIVDQIAVDIERVANELDIPAYALTKAKYFKGEGTFTEWQFRKYGGFNSIKNTYFESDEERDESTVIETNELRKSYRKLRKHYGEVEFMLRRIEDAVAAIPTVKVTPYKVTKKIKQKEPRTLNLLLSDLHFGSDLTIEQHSHAFGKVEEARALGAVVRNVCNYKIEYRDQTELVVNILGDTIENVLHGVNSADHLHMQAARAMYLLSQAIARFSENFPKVVVNFAVGNHGRDTSIHHSRATDLKWNALETTIYYGVKLACQSLQNVSFHQPLTPWITYKAQGHNVYATHGDTNLNPGNPGSKVDIKGLENQTNKINASLSDRDEYAVFAVGHVHHAFVTTLSNATHLITNGALVPPNSYAQTLNIMESQQIQVLWETTPEYPVGDFRFINVTKSGKDKSLDKVIKPFKGLDFV